MTLSKVPKALILFVILALAGAVVVVGCGGGGSSSSESTAEEAAPPAEEEPAEEKEEEPAEEEPAEEEKEPAEEEAGGEKEAGGGEAAAAEEGKTIFTSTCGTCHTLKEAGTSGTIGPDLDEIEPSLAEAEAQVTNGGGGMPAFGKEGILTPEEVKAVATYVSSVAGTE
jgi:mono/diheme cytochrome c family protein